MPRTKLTARSTADVRRAEVIEHALSAFADTGYFATRVSAIAAASDISEAYIFRLFGGKLELFLAALDHCYAKLIAAMSAGAARGRSGSPGDVLGAMAEAYAELIADRDLIALQVHAQSAASMQPPRVIQPQVLPVAATQSAAPSRRAEPPSMQTKTALASRAQASIILTRLRPS